MSDAPRRIQAQVDVWAQTGPDSHESYTKTMILSPTTTVAEIVRWYDRCKGGGRVIRILVEVEDE
jgi:hypothetical protein